MGISREMRPLDWAVATWAALLVCGVLLLVTWPISPWASWNWGGQEVAAWVQAVGSIGAIVGAIVTAARQNAHQSKLLRKQQADEHTRQWSADLKRDLAESFRRAKEKKRAEEAAHQRRLLQHRRVNRAAVELVHMFRRALNVEVHLGHPRLDADEMADLRARLRAIEDDDLPEALEMSAPIQI